MTLGIGWVGKRADGREHLYLASDSRTSGEMILDCSPKIMTLPRSDSAICFAGVTSVTYPLMMQLFNAIAAHKPAIDRSLDIVALKTHVIRVFTDMVKSIFDPQLLFCKADIQFLFGGYSWKQEKFCLWTIYYSEATKDFHARPAVFFHDRISQVAFIGDRAKDARSILTRQLNRLEGATPATKVEFAPLIVLRDLLRLAGPKDSIGGPPQLIRIAKHMNTRVLAVRWPGGKNDRLTLMGRQLFDYENVDNRGIDTDSLKQILPKRLGN